MPRPNKTKAKAPSGKKAAKFAKASDRGAKASAGEDPAPAVVAGEAPSLYNHLHRELADSRRAGETYILGKLDRARPLVDVGGSPRLLQMAVAAGFPIANIISLCPDLMAGDKERSNRIRRAGGTPLDMTLSRWLLSTRTVRPQFVMTHSLYHLDRETIELLSEWLAAGASAYSVHHTFKDPFTKMKGAKAFVYSDKSAYFGWPYALYMEVEGNNFVYDHRYPPICMLGYQRVSAGFLVATLERPAPTLHCGIFRLELAPRSVALTVPAGLSRTQREYADWEKKGWLGFYHDKLASDSPVLLNDAYATKTLSGTLVIDDSDLVAETYKMISRRGIPSEAFIRVSAIKAVERKYEGLPSMVMMETAERLVDRMMTETHSTPKVIAGWLSRFYNSLPGLPSNSSTWVKHPERTQSVCFAERYPDEYELALERIGAARCLEDEACSGKQVTVRFGRSMPDMPSLLSFGGCSHNLEASLAYRIFRDVPTRKSDARFLTTFAALRDVGYIVAPPSGPEWIARFSGPKRRMYEAAALKYTSYAEETKTRFYDIMVKTNENVIEKEEGINKPRTICYPTPNVRLCTGRWAYAVSKAVADYWNGERPVPLEGKNWRRRAKIYPVYCPTRSVNDLNDIIKGLPVKYAIWGDIAAFDASVEEGDIAEQYTELFEPYMTYNHAEELEKTIFGDMCGVGDPKTVKFRVSDERVIEIDNPKLRSGDSITSTTGTMKNIDISVRSLQNAISELLLDLWESNETFNGWVFCFGDDLLILTSHAIDTVEYAASMKRLGFEIEVDQCEIAFGCPTPPDFLKHILITSPLQLIPDPANWLKKFNVLWTVESEDLVDLWRAKLTALSGSAAATPVVAELTSHLLSLLGRASEGLMDHYNLKYRHPDVAKISDAAMPPYTQIQLEEFLAIYKIPISTWADFQHAVPRMVARGSFVHPILSYFC